ncbi:hypothetical protein V502_06464 [Pseudogymnoascus sp. VKM F-4520 (FW-2644)]|nr:hypothetical protein V502_06464 [Pseudogymnoascus sp. VKM F-4520 (FW-2644)]
MMPSTMDEEFKIIICGCGPTGALLSANLGRLGVRHLILEKESGITTDPRGIVLDEDGIRSLQGVGKYEELFRDVGKSVGMFRFIEGQKGLTCKPFLQFNQDTITGGTGHVGFISHKQPALEKQLRLAMNETFCNLRSNSTVVAIEEDEEFVYVEYRDGNGQTRKVRAKFLVGADGKTGFTRKKYLEPRGVVMEKSRDFHYEAIWVALNWRLILPTPESHPKFPLWDKGFTPEEVYDLFFPPYFNFICDPARPAVCGRFGRTEDRLWRFEFVVKEGEDGNQMSTQEETRRIIFPYLRHPGKKYGLSEDVSWPEDCIECVRSRPFSFSARSCNRWSVGRVILCGDAAHVFPPFGGQGIASGFRDATSLAWRLRLAINSSCKDYDVLLRGWYSERKQQLERSLAATIANGDYCNEPSQIKAFVRRWVLWAVQLVPTWRRQLEQGPRAQGMTKYDWAPGMPFLPQFGGGKSFPQVFCAPINGPAPPIPMFTDDAVFNAEKNGCFQIVALVDSLLQLTAAMEEVKSITRQIRNGIILDTMETTYLVHNQIGSVSDVASAHIDLLQDTTACVRILDAEEYSSAGVTRTAIAANFTRPAPLYYDPNRVKKDLGATARLWKYSNYASSSSSESSPADTTPQFLRHIRYRSVDGANLFRFFVIISPRTVNTRSDSADVAGIAK